MAMRAAERIAIRADVADHDEPVPLAQDGGDFLEGLALALAVAGGRGEEGWRQGCHSSSSGSGGKVAVLFAASLGVAEAAGGFGFSAPAAVSTGAASVVGVLQVGGSSSASKSVICSMSPAAKASVRRAAASADSGGVTSSIWRMISMTLVPRSTDRVEVEMQVRRVFEDHAFGEFVLEQRTAFGELHGGRRAARVRCPGRRRGRGNA